MTQYIKTKKIFHHRRDEGVVVLNILVVICVLLLGFFYLFQTNSLVGRSYEIREKKERLKGLQSEIKELETEIAQWQSPLRLEEMVKGLGMVEVKEATYLPKEKEMAVKE